MYLTINLFFDVVVTTASLSSSSITRNSFKSIVIPFYVICEFMCHSVMFMKCVGDTVV